MTSCGCAGRRGVTESERINADGLVVTVMAQTPAPRGRIRWRIFVVMPDGARSVKDVEFRAAVLPEHRSFPMPARSCTAFPRVSDTTRHWT